MKRISPEDRAKYIRWIEYLRKRPQAGCAFLSGVATEALTPKAQLSVGQVCLVKRLYAVADILEALLLECAPKGDKTKPGNPTKDEVTPPSVRHRGS